MSKDKISFVIPAHDRISQLKLTLESVMGQEFENVETIVVDDNSEKPLSMSLGQDFPKIRFIRLDKNFGPSTSRNKGLVYVTGDYICFLDSDDILVPNFSAEMVKICQIKNTPALCLSKTFFYGDITIRTKIFHFLINSIRNLVLRALNALNHGKLPRECFFSVSTSRVVLPKKTIEDKKFNENLGSCEDWEFIIRVMKETEVYICPKELIKFGFSKTSQTHQGRNQTKWRNYDYVIKMLPRKSQFHPFVIGFKIYKELFSRL